MRLQMIRSAKGELRGVAVLFGRGHIEAGRKEEQPWRICDTCLKEEAIVFCASDNVYVGEKCLERHTVPGYCRFLSVSAAREVARAALMESASYLTVDVWQ